MEKMEHKRQEKNVWAGDNTWMCLHSCFWWFFFYIFGYVNVCIHHHSGSTGCPVSSVSICSSHILLLCHHLFICLFVLYHFLSFSPSLCLLISALLTFTLFHTDGMLLSFRLFIMLLFSIVLMLLFILLIFKFLCNIPVQNSQIRLHHQCVIVLSIFPSNLNPSHYHTNQPTPYESAGIHNTSHRSWHTWMECSCY